jgi:hypothetical protein
MTLNDLKTGMIVKTREGKYHIIMRDFIDQGDILAGLSYDNRISNSWINLSKYNQDMTHSEIPSLDIVDVYASSVYSADTPTRLIWERCKQVTINELEEKFGCKVKIVGNEEEHNDGWIPCSERLPENDDDVLCWYEYRIMQGTHEGEMNQKFEIGYYNKYFKRWGGEVSSGRDCKVIAWRPLPEPYKEDEEE